MRERSPDTNRNRDIPILLQHEFNREFYMTLLSLPRTTEVRGRSSEIYFNFRAHKISERI